MTLELSGVSLKANRSLDEPALAIGEAVKVLVYRLYAFDENHVVMVSNEALEEKDIYYI